jgi:hypothetical protein
VNRGPSGASLSRALGRYQFGARLHAMPSGPGWCVLVTAGHYGSPCAFAPSFLARCKWCELSSMGV